MGIKDKQRNEIQKDRICPKAKAERLRRVRNLANLSREELCTDSGINLTTLISWEVGRFGGMPAKGASRVIARVAKEGVFCTPEWLLFEIGPGPEVRVDYKKSSSHSDTSLEGKFITEQEKISEELILFRTLNKDSIDLVIQDDAMLPHYNIGDHVGGTKRYGDKINSLISWDCIVQLNDGRITMRNVQPGPTKNTFNLISINLHTKVKDAILYDVNILSAAPILWHRRKEPSI